MKTANIRNTIVLEHDTIATRWLDIWGECQKYNLDNGFPTDNTTGDPAQFTMTVTEVGVGNTTAVNSATQGESMLITTAANEYDGINLQLKGEAFKCAASKPLYFGCKLKVSDATQTDLLMCLAETDTALLNVATSHGTDYGTSDLIGFLKLDGTTTISTQTVVDGTVTASADYGSALGTDFITLEMYYDGETITYYADGNKITCVSASLPDGDLTPTINFRAGSAGAETCSIAWWRSYQAN